uniref:Uncharacterized protein n=1 Tax=Anopheles christyi TaxID=43041 RepID=A0A182K6W8_9DIPT
MDKLSTIQPAVCGVTDVKFSRPLPSSSFSIENLIAVKRRRSAGGCSSPEIDPVDQGSCSPPAASNIPPGGHGGGLFLEASQQQQQQQQYLAAAAAGYSAAMLSFSSFPPLYHPWSTGLPTAGRYLSQAANEKLSTLLFHHSSGGNKSHPGGIEPCPGTFPSAEPHQPSGGMVHPRASSPRGARSGDKLFPSEADLLSKVYAVYHQQQHQHSRYLTPSSPGAGYAAPPLEPPLIGAAAHPQQQQQQPMEQSPGGTIDPGSDGGLEEDERTRPIEDGGESADGSAYSDDISLTLSPSGCGKTTGKLLMMGR